VLEVANDGNLYEFLTRKETVMLVKNLHVTAEKKCTVCGSWLKHWEKKTGEKAKACMKKGCSATAEVGAHVKKVGTTDNSHYIIPLCQGCNKLTTEFELNSAAKLASATPCTS
jgi:hypothetical protein